MEVVIEKIPLDTGPMQLAVYVVQKANHECNGEMLEQRLYKDQGIVLLFASRSHVCYPQNTIMMTEQCHKCCIIEELCASFLSSTVGSSETSFTPI
jgi:hypothetical protein